MSSWEERGSRQPSPECGGHSPCLGREANPTARPRHRASAQRSLPTPVYRILGTFILWMDGLTWLGLWAPPSHVALISTPKELQALPELLGPRAEGLEVWRPPSPLPGQASTPWLSRPAAAEFNAGAGRSPAP